MSYTGENREKRQSNFRTTMDIGMGVFYTVIGSVLIYARSFGRLEDIPRVIAYLLGGMMVIGGIARFYRGIKVFLPNKKNPDINPPE